MTLIRDVCSWFRFTLRVDGFILLMPTIPLVAVNRQTTALVYNAISQSVTSRLLLVKVEHFPAGLIFDSGPKVSPVEVSTPLESSLQMKDTAGTRLFRRLCPGRVREDANCRVGKVFVIFYFPFLFFFRPKAPGSGLDIPPPPDKLVR